jgi:hypothetical protein
MTQATARRRRALSLAVVLAVVALAGVAGCAPNRLLHQQANPEYVGKPFKRVLVVAVTKENVLGRVYEDRMVALLGQRGIKGVPAYASLGTAGAVDEATLRGVIAKTGVDGMLITRTTSVDESTVTTPGYTVAVGYGWGGLYGYYSGVWQTTYVPARTTAVGPTRTVSETRLFDTKSGTLAWSGMIGTTDRDGESDTTSSVQQYAGIVFDAMARDGII